MVRAYYNVISNICVVNIWLHLPTRVCSWRFSNKTFDAWVQSMSYGQTRFHSLSISIPPYNNNPAHITIDILGVKNSYFLISLDIYFWPKCLFSERPFVSKLEHLNFTGLSKEMIFYIYILPSTKIWPKQKNFLLLFSLSPVFRSGNGVVYVVITVTTTENILIILNSVIYST